MIKARGRREELFSEIIADGLDKLATLDLHGRGIVAPIYSQARSRQGGLPLSFTFAKALIDSSIDGRACIIATGFIIRKAMQPETDGMTGSAYLAYVLSKGLGLTPVLICEETALAAVKAAVGATGLKGSAEMPKYASAAAGLTGSFFAIGYPIAGEVGKEGQEKAMREAICGLDPCLFLTIERPGMNAKGVPHTTFGVSTDDISARIDSVLNDMSERGVPTFAVGDMGNELGMGAVSELVGEITPYGKQCMCGCGGGVAAAMSADFMMMGSISDDACYAIGASIAQQLGRDELLPDEVMIHSALSAAVKAGAVDGLTAANEPSIDMIAWSEHARIINLMRAAVIGAREHDRARPQFIDHLVRLEKQVP